MNSLSEKSTPWGLIALLLAVGLVSAGYIGKAPPALPAIRDELSLGMVTAGWIVSMIAVFGTGTGIFAGLLGDKVGHGKVILTACGVMAFGAVLGSIADDALLLLTSRAIEGAGYIAGMVSIPSLIAHLSTERNRSLAVGIWSCVTPGGMAIAMVTAPFILEPFGWRPLWQITAALSMLGLFAMFIVVWRTPRVTPTVTVPYIKNIRLTITQPGPWILAICFATYTFQWVAVMVWLPTFVLEERGLDVGLAASLAAVAVAFNILGNFAAAWLVHWGVRLWVALTIGTTVMGGSALMIFPDYFSDVVRFGLVLVFSFVGALQPVALLACAPKMALASGQLGATNGLMYQGSQLGNLIGPPILAFAVVTMGNWADAGYVLFALTLINIVLALKLRKLETTKKES